MEATTLRRVADRYRRYAQSLLRQGRPEDAETMEGLAREFQGEAEALEAKWGDKFTPEGQER